MKMHNEIVTIKLLTKYMWWPLQFETTKFFIHKKPRSMMKNYFTCKHIILITPYIFLWLKNILISKYNKCSKLTLTNKIEEPLSPRSQRLVKDKSYKTWWLLIWQWHKSSKLNTCIIQLKETNSYQIQESFFFLNNKKVSCI